MSTLIARDKKVVWHPFSPLKGGYPMHALKSAKGIYLYTEDGQKIIDGISSWWVNTLGHSNEGIARALAAQASTLEHVIFAGFTHEPAVELSERLLKMMPSDQEKVFFSDNGSTAVEVGLKMAIQYWINRDFPERRRIIAMEGAYHGDTFGSMAVGDRGPFTAPFHPYLFDVDFIPFPTGDGSNSTEALRKLVSKNGYAAFIFEPLVQGAAGMQIYSPEILDQLIGIAREQDILCIADEIFTGFYRTGKFLASDHLVNKPDIFCLSKGLTAGTLAMSVTTANSKVVQVFDTDRVDHTFYHGHSFTGNPLGCAVALESLNQLESEQILTNIDHLVQWQGEFSKRINSHESVRTSRNLGTILSIELKSGTATGYFNNLRDRIYSFFLERGILLRPLGNIIYFLPPYVINEKEVHFVHKTIEEFLDEYEAELKA